MNSLMLDVKKMELRKDAPTHKQVNCVLETMVALLPQPLHRNLG